MRNNGWLVVSCLMALVVVLSCVCCNNGWCTLLITIIKWQLVSITNNLNDTTFWLRFQTIILVNLDSIRWGTSMLYLVDSVDTITGTPIPHIRIYCILVQFWPLSRLGATMSCFVSISFNLQLLVSEILMIQLVPRFDWHGIPLNLNSWDILCSRVDVLSFPSYCPQYSSFW